MRLDPELSRRGFLRGLAGAAIAAGLAACGQAVSSSSAPTTSPGPTPSSTPGGSVSPLLASPSASTAVASATPATASASPDPAILRQKVARMLLVGFRGSAVGPDSAVMAALAGGLGGVILFDHDQTTGGLRNIRTPTQLRALTATLRGAAPGPILIAADQEGGRVSRLNPAQGFPATRSQAAVGATGDPTQARAAGRAMGATMAAAGIDFDLAPVVDVDVDPSNPAIGALDRSFSSHPSVVASMAGQEIAGLHERGIRCAIKHFPGLGSAKANTDFASADVTATWTEAELGPFRTLIDGHLPDAVMVAHLLDRKLDPSLLASLSPRIVGGMLRDQLGFDGVVMTDDLGAVAITSRYHRAEAIALAIEAGNDLLTFANQATYVEDLAAELVETMVGLVASGRISEARVDASIARLDHLLATDPSG